MTTAKTTDAVTTQNLIAERTTKALVTAASGVEKVVNTVVAGLNTEVNAAVQNLSNLSEQVQDKQSVLNSLTKEHEQKVDDLNYQLKIKVRDNKEATLKELLKEFGLAEIKKEALDDVYHNLNIAQQDNSEKLQEAVNDAVERAEAKAERTLDAVVADNKIKIAQFTAQATSDAKTIDLLQTNLDQSREDLKKEREARVTIEEHRSNASGVVVNTNK